MKYSRRLLKPRPQSMTILPIPAIQIDASHKAGRTRTHARGFHAQSEHLRYHLRSQLASVVDLTNTRSGDNIITPDWQFVPPCLLSTTSGALSPHIFHRSLEKIHCDHTLYPHLEEDAFQDVPVDEKESWDATSNSLKTPEMDTNRIFMDHDSDSDTKFIVAEITPPLKQSRNLGGVKMQYGTARPPLRTLDSKVRVWSPQDVSHFRNRGRLASSRWSFFHEWHYKAAMFEDDRRALISPETASWSYSALRTTGSTTDFIDEDQERTLVFGSYVVVVGLILLSLWVLAHHNHPH